MARAKVERLRSELAIDDGSLVAVGYADLLLDAPEALLRAADAAMRNAYAPYSHFKVGAALRGASGGIYAGANVENASYPQGQCAETSALGALVAAGEIAITAVAVVSDRVLECPPCGGCRQRLAEFGSPGHPRPPWPPRSGVAHGDARRAAPAVIRAGRAGCMNDGRRRFWRTALRHRSARRSCSARASAPSPTRSRVR